MQPLQPLKPMPVSPLLLSDRLLSLAQDADRAGLSESASHLVGLALRIFDEQPRRN